MNFRTISDLSRVIYANSAKIPRDIEIVVGVPRSGMLAANIIALAMNRPLAALDDYLEGRVFQSGRRRTISRGLDDSNPLSRKVLVVDDDISSGEAMREVRGKLDRFLDSRNVTALCVFGSPSAPPLADVVLETVDRPLICEWNFLHHPHLARCCVDIDGVLCRDAMREEDDDGVRYQRFLNDACPLFIPTVRIGWLVTSRLEKYRSQTEEWLCRHGVEYDELIMLNLPDLATRRRLSASGEFKGDVYKKLKRSRLFIESSRKDAVQIARISGKEVLSVDCLRLVKPGMLSGAGFRHRAQSGIIRRLRKIKRSFRPAAAHQ